MPAALRRCVAVLLLAGALLTLSGCGGSGDAGALSADLRERATAAQQRARERTQELRRSARRIREDARRIRERIRERVDRVLSDIRKAVPEAPATATGPRSRGRDDRTTIDAFLQDVLTSVDAYWTKTLTASGVDAPRVTGVWVPPGRRYRTGCGAPADDRAAFYCPADDTIYVGQVIAAELYRGVDEDLPGARAGYGRAVGDFGVAYVVAHEYGHNVQNELGFFRVSPQTSASGSRPFELQADCMAGLWGNSVYRAGKLEPGDVQEAMDTALAVGDFEFGSPDHHGTPVERRDAWLTGFKRGDPAACRSFVTA